MKPPDLSKAKHYRKHRQKLLRQAWDKDYDKDFALDQRAVENLNAYAAVMGIVLKQDSVSWHRPFFQGGINKGDRNSAQIELGKVLSPEEQAVFIDQMVKEFGAERAAKFDVVASKEGLRVIHGNDMYSREAVGEDGGVINLKAKEKKTKNF